MTVLHLNACPPGLRGDVTKWLMEISTGIYVGQLNQRTREALWERICKNAGDGDAVMVYSARNEQGFSYYVHNCTWKPVDFDGVILMRRPLPERRDDGKKKKREDEKGKSTEDEKRKIKKSEVKRSMKSGVDGKADTPAEHPELPDKTILMNPEDANANKGVNAGNLDVTKTETPDKTARSKKAAPKRKTSRSLPLPYIPLQEEAPLPDSFVVLDLETTGLNPESDHIIEIACIRYRARTLAEEFHCLIPFDDVLPAVIQNLTGLTGEILLRQGRPLPQALPELLRFIGEDWIVGHNVAFDIRFIQQACVELQIQPPSMHAVDTCVLARILLFDAVPNFRLETLIRHFGFADNQAHRALPDARLTAMLYLKLNGKSL